MYRRCHIIYMQQLLYLPDMLATCQGAKDSICMSQVHIELSHDIVFKLETCLPYVFGLDACKSVILFS